MPFKHIVERPYVIIASLVLVLLANPLWIAPALGDGLVFNLPSDGTFAEFREENRFVTQAVLSDKLKAMLPAAERERSRPEEKGEMTGIVRISSVGHSRRAGQDCRWIELTRVPSGQDEPSNHILKILVPEKYLRRGKHPLDHAVLTFFNPKERDQANRESPQGFNRIGYELERFLPVFPPPLTGEKRLPPRTIETMAGTFPDCEVIAGTTQFDRPLLGAGRWAFKSKWQITLHPDAPFGVVELRSTTTGREFDEDGGYFEIEGDTTITLSRFGSKAAGTPIDQLRGN